MRIERFVVVRKDRLPFDWVGNGNKKRQFLSGKVKNGLSNKRTR